jgi:ketosteroid isomerase-like protein
LEESVMRTRNIIIVMLFFFGFGVSESRAQEWSAVQKEVWKNVNDYWALLAKGDVANFVTYFHTDYIGWDDNDAVPGNLEESKKMLNYFVAGTKFPFYSIQPLAIKVYGDFAFVHYIFSYVKEGADGKKSFEKGRWTDILMKQGNRWVMIGDHGGTSETKSME